MSEDWAERERQTNKLVRLAAEWCFAREKVTYLQLYGLCQLTWITKNYDVQDPAYVRSTKVPGLENVFRASF